MSNATDVNEDINSSFLRVASITIDLNDTQVKCNDGNDVTIGSDEICIVGKSTILIMIHAFVSLVHYRAASDMYQQLLLGKCRAWWT